MDGARGILWIHVQQVIWPPKKFNFHWLIGHVLHFHSPDLFSIFISRSVIQIQIQAVWEVTSRFFSDHVWQRNYCILLLGHIQTCQSNFDQQLYTIYFTPNCIYFWVCYISFHHEPCSKKNPIHVLSIIYGCFNSYIRVHPESKCRGMYSLSISSIHLTPSYFLPYLDISW